MFAGSSDGKVYGIDGTTGAVTWSAPTGGPIVGSPALGPGVVVVGSTDAKVYALDSATGVARWIVALPGAVKGGPAVAGGSVYVGSDPGLMQALTLTDGCDPLDQGDRGRRRHGPDRRAPSEVLFGGDRRRVFSYTTAGERGWVFDTNGPAASPPERVVGLHLRRDDRRRDRGPHRVDRRVRAGGLPIGFPVAPPVAVGGVVYAGAGNGTGLRR